MPEHMFMLTQVLLDIRYIFRVESIFFQDSKMLIYFNHNLTYITQVDVYITLYIYIYDKQC